ncbi:iron chelate uptake ABC transporter family permease subunit [Klebsiella pneumoniae subsp. pneumoniae]|nr:iron chelate uptake ABC transporter family permease subunit [Klebsiella pneumoniae subsp. pneumoniae]
MAPHIARMMGFRRTLPHMVISGLTGGLLLVFADWCGRMMMFLYQIPGGATVDLYRRALLYLFVEKAESLTVLDGFNIPGGAYRLPGATALCDLVARIRRNAPPPGKSPAPPGIQAPYSLANTDARRRWCCRYLLRCGPRT